MSITALSLNTGATVSSTGGTALNFTPSSNPVSNGIEVVDAASSDFIMRKRATFAFKPPAVGANGVASKTRWSGRIIIPSVRSIDGNIAYNLGEVRMELDNEAISSAVVTIAQMRSYLAQLAFVAALDNFFNYGNLS